MAITIEKLELVTSHLVLTGPSMYQCICGGIFSEVGNSKW